MESDFTDKQIVKIIESSFQPLSCSAKISDYDQKISFRVYAPDKKPILRFTETSIDKLRHRQTLHTILEVSRQRVEKLGHRLDPL